MDNFLNAGTWFAEQVRFEQQEITLGDITFPIIPLTDDHMESIQLADTYSEMIDIAVLNGMASGEARVCDNPRMDAYYDKFWDKYDGEPSVKAQLGEFICEIAGLSEVLVDAYSKKIEEDARAEEAKAHLEAEAIVNGDDLGDTSITLGQLESDATAYTTAA